MGFRFTKDPEAVLDYTFDWTPWLNVLPTADTITAATASVEPTGGLVVNSISHTATQTTVWLSGGDAGETYAVSHHITTVSGRQDDRTMTIAVRDK